MKKYIVYIGIGIVVVTLFILFRRSGVNNAALPIPTDSPGSPVIQITGTQYTNPTFGYTLTIPENLVVSNNGANNILIGPKEAVAGPGPANFIYVSVYTGVEQPGEVYNFFPNDYELLMKLNNGEGVSLADYTSGQDEWFTYTRIDDGMIAGQQVRRFQNDKPWEFPLGTTETRMMFENGSHIYVVGYYTGGDGVAEAGRIDPLVAYSILQTMQVQKLN